MDDIRVIPGHDRYGVTADGRVWSRARGCWRVMAQTQDGRGYPKVKLTGGYTVMVHLLVATVFIGERPIGMTVNHKDGSKLNPAADNLEYVTQSDNNRHAWTAGLQRSGWSTRRTRLQAMGHSQYVGTGNSYPGMAGRWARPSTEGGR